MQDHKSSACGGTVNTHWPPRVAVVGGGIAGLTCARELRSVVASQVERVHISGIDMARAVVEGLTRRGRRSAGDRDLGQLLEVHQ